MIVWTPEMSVGVEEIDSQHRSFIGILNEMIAYFEKGGAGAAAGPLIEGLCAYADFHFATEEKYFVQFRYELADEHIAEHRRMAQSLTGFRRGYFENGEDVIGELFAFAADWLTDHLMKQDHKYIACFREHGLK